jgi:HlyD family secretion protein
MPDARRRSRLLIALAILVAGGAALGWWLVRRPSVPEGFALSNGRLEAEEIHVATKLPGRIAEVLVDEGDEVAAGQVVARMDPSSLQAQLAQAQAEATSARRRLEAARAASVQRISECALAEKELGRTQALHGKHVASEQSVDIQRTRTETAHAACDAAKADVATAEAAIDTAEAQVNRIAADLVDCVLVAPRSGRIQHRLAEPGEVLAAGGRVLTLLDLGDVYMTLFLPAEEAGRIKMGAEARIVLDALPERAIPARISFVSDEAQFTPKQVETRSEREKLSFRVKAQVIGGRDPVLKPGAPGVAWVRLDAAAIWPEPLR